MGWRVGVGQPAQLTSDSPGLQIRRIGWVELPNPLHHFWQVRQVDPLALTHFVTASWQVDEGL